MTQESSSPTTFALPTHGTRWRRVDARSALAIGLGVAVTLCVYGYQFGRGNHSAYLLDAIRRAQPPQLANDWFTTQTFQYHIVFTQITALFMRLGIVAPAFAVAYVLLIVLFHVAWRGIVRVLGGDDVAYLLSVPLYFLCAAGTGLGMYQFFQDSSLLPSNIANVAMLCGIWMWLTKRLGWSGVGFGVAGIFHLNHALIGALLWIVMCCWSRRRVHLIGTICALVPSAFNLALAAHLKLARSGAMPLDQFVALYARFRHPHHYDPSTWPIGIWIAFGCTAIAAIVLLRGESRRFVVFFMWLNCIALVGAGIWYFSQTLIQMSLYRFSIYIQLLGCIATGTWIEQMLSRKRMVAILSAAACTLILVVCILRGPFFGMFQMPRDDADYLALCRWVEQHTPVDTVFVVPPSEEAMRVVGRRAIVVNYKAVPQLASELSQWRQRMEDVLAMNDLTQLPRGYQHTLPAIRERYDQLSADQLTATARKYGARYIITTHATPEMEPSLIPADATGRYFLYDLSR